MKHEDFNSDYNEVMLNERDVILEFLEDTADIRYGNQMFEWAVNVQVMAANGAIYRCIEVYRDKDVIVGFIVKDAEGNRYMWEAHNFAYGELSKIIDALPEVEDVIKRRNSSDLRCLVGLGKSINLTYTPYQYADGATTYEVYKIGRTLEDDFEYFTKVKCKDGEHYEIHKTLDYVKEEYLVKHIKSVMLRETEEYKELKEIFSLGQIGGVIFNNDVCVTPVGTDMQLRVKAARLSPTGELIINVATDGTGLNNMYPAGYFLREYEIDKEALATIIKEFRAEGDIMDTLNGHNKDLVKKINKLYANPALKDSFKIIISAITAQAGDKEILERTHLEKVPFLRKEYTRDVIHEILYEYCDDEDLETIIHFVGGYRPTMPYYVGENNDIIKFE